MLMGVGNTMLSSDPSVGYLGDGPGKLVEGIKMIFMKHCKKRLMDVLTLHLQSSDLVLILGSKWRWVGSADLFHRATHLSRYFRRGRSSSFPRPLATCIGIFLWHVSVASMSPTVSLRFSLHQTYSALSFAAAFLFFC